MEEKGRQVSKYEELSDRQRRSQVDLVFGALMGPLEVSRARAEVLTLGGKAAGDAHALAEQLDWQALQAPSSPIILGPSDS